MTQSQNCSPGHSDAAPSASCVLVPDVNADSRLVPVAETAAETDAGARAVAAEDE